MTDHLIRCITCPSDFTLTDGEIEFYRAKGFVLPKRCPQCRAARRASRAAEAEATAKSYSVTAAVRG